MQTIIEIPDRQIESLDRRCQVEGISRAELIQRAIAAYLAEFGMNEEETFGLWCKYSPRIDGLEYQERLRSEWES
jgi:metal-responsive CopG/Arc/MetJ family transcriptional regulator